MTAHPGHDGALKWSAAQEALAGDSALVAVTRGPEHRVVYSNGAYRRAHDKHAGADPSRLDDVLSTGRPAAHCVGPITFVCSPIRGPAGEDTCVLVVGVDESELIRSRSLPRTLHQPDELRVAARYRPGGDGSEAGGDWYDVIPIGAGRTALVIGDVMGRGAHAAEVMSEIRSALRAYARLDLPPQEVLSLLDALVSELQPVQIATCLYATFDPVDSSLTYSTAGHPPPLLRDPDGTVRVLPAQPGAALGVRNAPYPVQQVLLPAGAILVMYTDGLVERRGEAVEVGISALAEALRDADRPLEEFADGVLRRLGTERGEDDVALLLARSTPALSAGSPERSVRLQLDSGEEPARRARAYANGVLSAWQLPQALRDDIVIVVGELVVNAVLHSGVAQELRLRRTPHRVVLEVLDRSPRPPRPRPTDPEAESGRGLYMVAQLADRWGARPLEGGKSVWCEFLA